MAASILDDGGELRRDLPRQFGRLTVIRFAGRKGSRNEPRVECLCECGRSSIKPWRSLLTGKTQSCGCLSVEASRSRMTTHGHATKGRISGEYRVWSAVIKRCCCESDSAFPNYGGRGIQICDRWRNSFEAFLADVGPRPSLSHSLDRYPNNDGNYEPGNVRWATAKEQAKNRRSNVLLTANGETLHITEWAARIGTTCTIISGRLDRGWTVERAVTTPPGKSGRIPQLYSCNGEQLSIDQWAARLNTSKVTIRQRLKHGWSLELALTAPVTRPQRKQKTGLASTE